jgi:hypothetical protein
MGLLSRWIAVVALSTTGFGCTTVLYDGPLRRPSEVSSLTAGTRTKIVSIDATTVDGGRITVYEMLPGIHQIVATVKEQKARGPRMQRQSPALLMCLEAEPAESYAVSVWVHHDHLGSAIVKRSSGEAVETSCDAKPTDRTMVDGSSTETREASPATAAHRAVNERPEAHLDDGVKTPVFNGERPWFNLRMGFGLDFGGEDLVEATYTDGTTNTLSAGTGGVLRLGATLTPIWIEGAVALGVGASVGVKYNSVGASNGSVVLTRFPVELWGQTLLRMSRRSFLTLAVGGHKDTGISLSGSGLASGFNANFTSPWGFMIDAGYQAFTSRVFGWGISFHHARIKYVLGNTSINAASYGIDVNLLAKL